MKKTVYDVYTEFFQSGKIDSSKREFTADEVIEIVLDDPDREPVMIGRFDTEVKAVTALNAQDVYTDRAENYPSGKMLTGRIAFVQQVVMEQDEYGDWDEVDFDYRDFRATGWKKGLPVREEFAQERLSKMYSPEILDAIKVLYESLDLYDEDDFYQRVESDEEVGYFTLNKCRNGREVAWYSDGSDERCIYVDDYSELNTDKIEQELL